MEIRELKKIKPIFLDKNQHEITPSYLDELIEKEKNTAKKNFLRGCKHTTERHYTEAIKWFQLADEYNDSVLLILFLSLKLDDTFLFNEYFTENLECGDIFSKEVEFKPFVKWNNDIKPLDFNLILYLKESLGGRW